MSGPRLPAAFWALWAGFLANRLGLLAPAFLTLYLTSQQVTTDGQTALAIGGYGAGAIGGGLLGGVIADRAGPRRTLWTSQALAGATGFALMTVRAPPLVMGLLLVLGTLNGFGRSAGYGLTTHLAPAAQWAQAYGRLYWATSIGTSVTAVLSGVLLQVWPAALFLPGVLGAAGYAAVALVLPEVRTSPAAGPVGTGRAGLVAGALRPFLAPFVGPFLLLTLVLSVIYAQRHAAMPVDMYAHGLSYGRLGLLFSFGAVLVIVVQPISTGLTGRLPPGRAFALSALLIGGGFWLNLVAHTPVQYAVVIAVWTFGEILTAPLALTFMAAHAPDGEGSTYQGAYGFMWTLGFAVGAPVGHLVFMAAGRDALWWSVLGLGAAVAWGHIVLARRCGWLKRPAQLHLPPGGSDPCASIENHPRIFPYIDLRK